MHDLIGIATGGNIKERGGAPYTSGPQWSPPKTTMLRVVMVNYLGLCPTNSPGLTIASEQ